MSKLIESADSQTKLVNITRDTLPAPPTCRTPKPPKCHSHLPHPTPPPCAGINHDRFTSKAVSCPPSPTHLFRPSPRIHTPRPSHFSFPPHLVPQPSVPLPHVVDELLVLGYGRHFGPGLLVLGQMPVSVDAPQLHGQIFIVFLHLNVVLELLPAFKAYPVSVAIANMLVWAGLMLPRPEILPDVFPQPCCNIPIQRRLLQPLAHPEVSGPRYRPDPFAGHGELRAARLGEHVGYLVFGEDLAPHASHAGFFGVLGIHCVAVPVGVGVKVGGAAWILVAAQVEVAFLDKNWSSALRDRFDVCDRSS